MLRIIFLTCFVWFHCECKRIRRRRFIIDSYCILCIWLQSYCRRNRSHVISRTYLQWIVAIDYIRRILRIYCILLWQMRLVRLRWHKHTISLVYIFKIFPICVFCRFRICRRIYFHDTYIIKIHYRFICLSFLRSQSQHRLVRCCRKTNLHTLCICLVFVIVMNTIFYIAAVHIIRYNFVPILDFDRCFSVIICNTPYRCRIGLSFLKSCQNLLHLPIFFPFNVKMRISKRIIFNRNMFHTFCRRRLLPLIKIIRIKSHIFYRRACWPFHRIRCFNLFRFFFVKHISCFCICF